MKHFAWGAAILASVLGGTALLAVVILGASNRIGLEGDLVLRYFASLAVGSDAIMRDDNTTLVIGVLVNYGVSLVYGLLITISVHRWGLWVGIIGGAILGASVYAINLYTMTIFFEWFFTLNSNLLFISHIVFGVVVGGVYEVLDTYDAGLQGGDA